MALVGKLKLLNLNNNELYSIPNCIKNLTSLETLHLHYNKIQLVPASIIQNLREISLRGNPLVSRFVKHRLNKGIKHSPPSLFELAARTIKTNGIQFKRESLPPHIVHHLECATKCPNPKCNGVYFDTKYFQVRFVDCCGVYQLPMLQYLCSPTCDDDGSSSDSDGTVSGGSSVQGEVDQLYQRVILGGV